MRDSGHTDVAVNALPDRVQFICHALVRNFEGNNHIGVITGMSTDETTKVPVVTVVGAGDSGKVVHGLHQDQ